MVTTQNAMDQYDLSYVSYYYILKVRKCQLDSLSRFRIVEEKRHEVGVKSPPPGKVIIQTASNSTQSSSFSMTYNFGF